MNAVWIVLLSFCAFALGYRYYAKKIEGIFGVDPAQPTPAIRMQDGLDYVPAKNWLMIFGHHFSSIAGAGPVIGPIIACTAWGWGPSLAWVILGSLFIGGIHDFGSLMISIREEGASVADIAAEAISPKAKMIFSVFIWLALLLIIAVFSYLAANTFVTEPGIVVPSLGLIPVAVAVGLALYHLKANTVLTTVLGLAALVILIAAGKFLPITMAVQPQLSWIIVLLVYSYFASIVPVNYLLQPRDYLSSFLLFFGMFLGMAGIFVSHPKVTIPFLVRSGNSLGSLWPMMFITIACGAVSGFHALVSSGTSSKQIACERDAKKIGFGAMFAEGFLAVLIIAIVGGGLSLAQFQFHVANNTNPINIYGESFGNLTRPFMGDWGMPFAVLILNAFILTTLDTTTRIARYITHELFRIKDRWMATGVVVALAGCLTLFKDSAQSPIWKKIWPAFGAANQLIAALALFVITCWLLSKNKPIRYTLVPAVFMLTTCLAAFGFQIVRYLQTGEILLVFISSILIIAALMVTLEVVIAFLRKQKRRGL